MNIPLPSDFMVDRVPVPVILIQGRTMLQCKKKKGGWVGGGGGVDSEV